jgi:hypothetical protein
MSYFRNFPVSFYRFGDNEDPVLFQNITAYVDLIDQIVDDATAYEKYTIIDGERPDTLSFKLYGSVDYYWTFYLINEKIRQQGWPLSSTEVYAKAKEFYPNTVVMTDESMHGEFYIGDIAATLPFDNPTFKGEILEKRYDLGQLVLKPIRGVRSITVVNAGSGYTLPPTVTISGDGIGASAQAILDSDTVGSIAIVSEGNDYTFVPTVTIGNPNNDRGDRATATAVLSNVGVSRGDVLYSQKGQPDVNLWDFELARELTALQVKDQWNSVHHYYDSNNEYVTIPLSSTAGKGVDFNQVTSGAFTETEVTFTQRLLDENEELSRIKVLKAGIVEQVSAEFNRLLRS